MCANVCSSVDFHKFCGFSFKQVDFPHKRGHPGLICWKISHKRSWNINYKSLKFESYNLCNYCFCSVVPMIWCLVALRGTWPHFVWRFIQWQMLQMYGFFENLQIFFYQVDFLHKGGYQELFKNIFMSWCVLFEIDARLREVK